jgi:hypothetical protein
MGLSSKLTARQQAFLQKLLEIYQERQEPVHYTAVAEALGVSRFSAYDMLKVLEKKGVASSTYALDSAHSGPGRSMIVFSPTPQAAASLAPGIHDPGLGEEWQSARERILNKLRSAREANYREALNDILARLPEANAPLTFCTEMVAALLLNMRRAGVRARGLNPFRALAALRGGGSAALEMLAGLSLGATLSDEEENGPSITRRLLDQAHRYQSNLSRLNEEARAVLIKFLEEALEALD